MDKASRAIRRSGVKLLSLSGGHTDLNVLVSDVKDIRSTAKAFMNSQSTASQDLMKWVGHQENRAIEDVVSQIAELNLMWTEAQKAFVDSLKDYKSMFDVILDGEKQVANAKSNVLYCIQKEEKIRKELQKAAKRGTTSEIRILEARLSQLVETRTMADAELKERIRETEAVKLTRMKDGLLNMAESYMEMATRCSTVFTAQRDIALQLPDVQGRELERIKYSGSEASRQIVENARDEVNTFNACRRRSSTSIPLGDEPPPPYTPPEAATRARPPPPAMPPAPSQRSCQHSAELPVPNELPGSREPMRRTPSQRSTSSQHSTGLPVTNDELPAYSDLHRAGVLELTGSPTRISPSARISPSVSPECNSLDGSRENSSSHLSVGEGVERENSSGRLSVSGREDDDIESLEAGHGGSVVDDQCTELKQHSQSDEPGSVIEVSQDPTQDQVAGNAEHLSAPKDRPVPSPRQNRPASFHDDEYDTAEDDDDYGEQAVGGVNVT